MDISDFVKSMAVKGEILQLYDQQRSLGFDHEETRALIAGMFGDAKWALPLIYLWLDRHVAELAQKDAERSGENG